MVYLDKTYSNLKAEYTDQIKLLPDVNRFNYFVEVSLEFVWVDILLLAFVIFLCIPKTGEVFK